MELEPGFWIALTALLISMVVAAAEWKHRGDNHRRDAQHLELERRLVEIEAERHAWATEERSEQLAQREAAARAALKARFHTRLVWLDHQESRFLLTARNLGPAPAMDVALSLHEPSGNQFESTARSPLLRPDETVKITGTVDLSVSVETLTAILAWTDGTGPHELGLDLIETAT